MLAKLEGADMPKTMKLTKRAVDALKPAEARFVAWDSEISALAFGSALRGASLMFFGIGPAAGARGVAENL